MKKNQKLPISPVMAVLLVWLVVLAVYAFAYYIPAQAEMNQLNADVAVMRTEADAMEQYLTDSSSLKKEIEALKKEIDKIKDEYVNDANVNMVISDAIQRFEISLSSVTLDSVTTYNGMRALPINLSLHGTTENILQFIDFFENSEDGSFVVRGVSLDVNAYSTDANIVLYLCTPAV